MALTICICRDAECPHCQGQCPEFVQKGRCQPCQRHYEAQHKGRQGNKGSGSRWKRFRIAYLKRNPFCVKCGNEATVIDHLNGQGRAGVDAFKEWNCQPMCATCHNRKTATEDGGFGRYG